MSGVSADWIAVDWGTSNLRVWAMDAAGAVLDEGASDKGMGALTAEGFEPALLDLVGDWLDADRVTPVICCGMVGARQGWAEAAYVAVPCPPPDAGAATKVAARDPRIVVRILPGLKQTTPPDVMRGEETQIAGFLRAEPTFDGVLCLPGTHTKWVHISAGEIVSFRSFMTGEIFALLAERSVLRFGLEGDGFDDAAFDKALPEAMSDPQMLAAQLFGLRAGALVSDLAVPVARARLSGLLIGAELAGARPYWLGREVAVVGDGALAGLYCRGLAAQGVPARTLDVAGLTLAGLTAAFGAAEAGI